MRIIATALAAVSLAVLFTLVVSAQSSVQGYAADASIDNGTIVQLDSEATNKVKVASQAELEKMFGVTVDRAQLPVQLSNGGLKNEVFVATAGTYNVRVSTQGGPIASGDYITLSAINGIGMKAGTEEATVLGRANASFDGKGTTLGTTTLTDSSGNEQTVQLGAVPVTIEIMKNPNEKSTDVAIFEFLKRVGQAVAEKEVNPIRIYLSVAITVISLIAAIVVIYSGVRNGVISIGRNPMSKKSIFRALLQIILTSFLILIIGLFAVYLLLKL